MSIDLVATLTQWRSEELRSIAGQCLETDVISCEQPTVQKIGRSAGLGTSGIFHVSGQAHTTTDRRLWSAVVKVLGQPEHPHPGTEYDPFLELTVYRSGVFSELCGGVRSARCYAIDDEDGLQYLWLEDLSTAPQPPWEPDHYTAAAKNIGQFNAYWPEDALPQWDWLNQNNLRESFLSPRVQRYAEQLNELRDHPLIQRAAPAEILPGLFRQWEQLDALLALAEAAPKGICHLDCHTKNMFPMHDSLYGDYTVGIDWVKVGIDCYGIDVAHMVSAAMKWLEIPVDQAMPLVDRVFDAYLAGLKLSGWSGDEAQVRLAYLARLSYEAARIVSILVNAITTPRIMASVEQLWQKPMAEICDQWAGVYPVLLHCHAQAITEARIG